MILAVFGVAGVLGTSGTASAQLLNSGPYYSSAAFPLANPPGYYTNLYAYQWAYPWYAGYNYSSSPYYGWWQNGGYATYRVCNPNPAFCPIPGYIGGPQYGGPPFVPHCSPYSSHAGGPGGAWLQNGQGMYPPSAAVAVPVTIPAPVAVPVPVPVIVEKK
jgi:hypothetical protein